MPAIHPRPSGRAERNNYVYSVNVRAKKLREEVLELPRATRAELAHDLLLSLEEGELEAPEAVEKAWAKEIDRRMLDVKEGRVKLIPAEEVFRQVRANLKRVRTQRGR